MMGSVDESPNYGSGLRSDHSIVLQTGASWWKLGPVGAFRQASRWCPALSSAVLAAESV